MQFDNPAQTYQGISAMLLHSVVADNDVSWQPNCDIQL